MKRFLALLSLLLAFSFSIAQGQKTLEPKDHYNYTMGKAAYNEGNYEIAVQLFVKEIGTYPENGYAYFWLSRIFTNYFYYESAIASLRTAQKNISKQDKYYQGAVNRELGILYMQFRQPNQALEYLSLSLKMNPGDVEAYLYRGRCYQTLGDDDKAIGDFSSAVKHGGESDALDELARGYERMGDFQKALQITEASLRETSDSVSLIAYRAELKIRQKKYDEAIDDLVLLLKMNDVYHLAMYMSQVPEEFGPTLEEKLLSDCSHSDKMYVYRLLGHFYRMNENYDRALYYYYNVYNQEKESSDMLDISRVWESVGDYETALRCLEAIATTDSVNYDISGCRADNLVALGRYEEAQAACQKGMDNSPESPDIYQSMGLLHSILKRFDDAAADYEMALVLNPEDRGLYFNYAMTQKKNGNKELADKYFKQVVCRDTLSSPDSYTALSEWYLGHSQKAVGKLDTSDYYATFRYYALVGQEDSCYHYLELALKDGFREFYKYELDDEITSVRSIPRFSDLIRRYREQMNAEINALREKYLNK